MEITKIEALMVISLEGSDRFLDPSVRRLLRGLVHSEQGNPIESPFTQEDLEELETRLPPYGMSDESTWGPFRVKLSNAIYEFEQEQMIESILPGGVKYARDDNEDPAENEAGCEAGYDEEV